MSAQTLPVTWSPRTEPLLPIAVAATGATAAQLAQRVLLYTDESLKIFQAVAGPGVLVILGSADHLPWVDGVTYLGQSPECPQLLSPTTLSPNLPLALLDQALRHRLQLKGTVAVLPSEKIVIALTNVRGISRDPLAAWLREEQRAAS